MIHKQPLVRKTFYSMLFPTMLTNLVTSIGSFSDTVIVGKLLGEIALSSITLTAPIFMMINTCAAMIAVGGSTIMSILTGKREKASSQKIFSLSLNLAFGIGILILIIGLIWMDPLIYLLGGRTDQLELLMKSYAKIILSGSPIFMINICLSFFVRNDGHANLVMSGMLSAIILNIILDLFFVLLCKMSVEGAAYAMIFSQIISTLIIASHFLSKKNTLRYGRSFSLNGCALIFKNGIGTASIFIFQFIVILLLNNLIMTVAGQIGITVYTVVFNLSLLALSIFEGLSQTIQPMISIYSGEENNSAIKYIMRLAFHWAIGLCLITTLYLECFPKSVISFLGLSSPSVIWDSIVAIRIYSLGIFLMTMNVLMGYYYQSHGLPKITAVITILRSFITPLAGSFIFSSFLGLYGVWIGLVFAELITLILWCGYVFWIQRKQNAISLLLLDLEKNDQTVIFHLEGKTKQLYDIMETIESLMRSRELSFKTQKKALIAIEEVVNNIIKYSNNLKPRNIEISLKFSDHLTLIIWDDSQPFDPTCYDNASCIKTNQFGLFLVKSTSQFFSYLPALGLNRIFLKYE